MQVIHHKFATPGEAQAHLDGIEFVNDSRITAWISNVDNCIVVIEDQDKHEPE